MLGLITSLDRDQQNFRQPLFPLLLADLFRLHQYMEQPERGPVICILWIQNSNVIVALRSCKPT